MNVVTNAKEKYLEHKNRHKEILDSAIKVFNAKGYGSATTAEISREAGVSEPVLYKHFANKKEMFLECFHSITDYLLKSYSQVYKKHPDDELSILTGFINVYVDFVKQNPDKSMFLVHVFSYKGEPDFEVSFRKFMRDSIKMVEKFVDSAQRKGTIENKIKSDVLACIIVNQYIPIVSLSEFIGPQCLTDQLILDWAPSILNVKA